jgi:hypothetical protein
LETKVVTSAAKVKHKLKMAIVKTDAKVQNKVVMTFFTTLAMLMPQGMKEDSADQDLDFGFDFLGFQLLE